MTIYQEVMDAEQKHFYAETEEEKKDAQELLNEVLELGLETLCKIRANKKARIDALKAEEKRISDQRKNEESKQGRLVDYISNLLEKAGGKTTAGSFKLSFRNSEATIIDDGVFFTTENDDYFTTKTTYSADKNKIKADLKEGVVIDGASILKNKNLQVK